MPNFYLVGGYVRDKILGIPSKDKDFAVVADSWEEMNAAVAARCEKIFLVTPEYFTIRGLDAEHGPVDFVLCRKDGEYTDGRRPDIVEPGTLEDDLARRDFTMNAIAMTENEELIDPFDGLSSLSRRIITCVGDTRARMEEDGLRLLRAIRFSITKNFALDEELQLALTDPDILRNLKGVSTDRVRDELEKCFRADSPLTIQQLSFYSQLTSAVFHLNPNLWFLPTTRDR